MSVPPNNDQPDARPTDPAPDGSVRLRRKTPPMLLSIFVALAVGGIIGVRSSDSLDRAMANIFTLVLAFVSLMSLLIWFCFFSGYARGLRLGLFYSGLAVVVLLGVLFKIESVSGELVPQFRYRWSVARDQLIAKPQDELAPKFHVKAPGANDSSIAKPGSEASLPAAVELPADSTDDFPQFLGPDRNAAVNHPLLAKDWAKNPPELVWKREIGAGWSGFAVAHGLAVTLEQRGPEELVTCYDAKTGNLVWFDAITARHESTLGGVGPRSTPTLHQRRVFALGATGVLRCLDLATGKLLWMRDLLAEFNVGSPGDESAAAPARRAPVDSAARAEEDKLAVAWGRAASPLIVDEMVIVPAGGPNAGKPVSLVAYDKTTGEEIWRGGDQQIGYASATLATLGGVRQILIVNESSVTGHDPATGKTLWSFPWLGNSTREANSSQAVPVGDDRVFISKGYIAGGALFSVKLDNGEWTTASIWDNKQSLKTKFTNVVITGGYAYGLSDGILECADLETGKRQWKHGRYKHGQLLRVADVLLIISEDGELAMVDIDPKKHVELGRIPALEGKTWNTLAISGPHLFVRNAEQAACYRLPVRQ